MSRPVRQDHADAIHLVRIQGGESGPIFFTGLGRASNLGHWQYLIERACDRNYACVHAFKWFPNAALLVLQRFSVPLDRILANVLGQYSRYLHSTGALPQSVSPYRARYESLIIAPSLLPYAVRHVYWSGIEPDSGESPLDYPYCSAQWHCAPRVPSWFCQANFLHEIHLRGYRGHLGCDQFLRKPESGRHRAFFTHLNGSRGQRAVVDITADRERGDRAMPALEQIVAAVAALLAKVHVPHDDSVLAMALVAWYATRSGSQTLVQLGQWFGRSPTTLRRDMESHRLARPELFTWSTEDLLALLEDPPPDEPSE